MDEIATELGISKKTIYQHFIDKDDIVYQFTLSDMNSKKCQWEGIQLELPNPIERMVKSIELFKQAFNEMNPYTLFDIKKYYPRAWELIHQHKYTFVLQCIKNDLHEGMECGIFRDDLNVDILSIMRLEQVQMGFDQAIYAPNLFSFIDVQIEFLNHFIRGILTQKGLEIYNEYTQK